MGCSSNSRSVTRPWRSPAFSTSASIGDTPIVKLNKVGAHLAPHVELYAKLTPIPLPTFSILEYGL